MKRLNIFILSFLLILLSATKILAADITPYNIFKTINLPDPTLSTNTIFQDKLGIIWIGTSRGLIRYDGYETSSIFNQLVIKGKNVMSILQIDDSHLLVGTLDGIYYINTFTGKPDKLPTGLSQVKSIRNMKIYENNLWIGTNGEGVWKYHLKKKTIQKIKHSKFQQTIVYAFCPVGRNMYVGSLEGLASVDLSTDKMTQINIPNRNKFVNSLLWDTRREALLIGTEGDLYKYFPRVGTMENVKALRRNVFKSLAFDRDRNLLIGTDAGLCVYNFETAHQYEFTYNASRQSICNNVIWEIYIDQDENAWLATGNGVTIMENPKWFSYLNMEELNLSEYGNNFLCTFSDSQQHLWLGGENGLLMLHGQHQNVQSRNYNINSKKYPIHHNHVRHIYEDRDHDLWIATDASIARLNKKTQQFEYYTIVNRQGETGKWAYNLYEDALGKLWVSTYSAGIFVIDKQALLAAPDRIYQDKTQTPEMEKRKGANCIQNIIPGDGRQIWLRNQNVIIGKDIVNGNEVRLHIQNETATYCNHTLWLATQDGKILKYDVKTKKLKELDLKLSNGAATTFVTQDDLLWFSCQDGIWQVNTKNDEISFCDHPKYMRQSGIYIPEMKKIIWGCKNGIVFYDISMQTKDREKIYITSIINRTGKQIALMPSLTEKIQLQREEYVSFELSSLKYYPHQEITFYYRLGDNHAWQSLKAGTNELSFVGIPSGTYKLQLSSTNPQIDKNAQITTYHINVPYPWYASSMAFIIYLFLPFAIVFFITKRYKHHCQKQIEQREKEQAMELLRQKNNFFVNMSHELKTPLSLIIAPLSRIIKTTPDSALKKSLDLILKNTQQLNLLIHKVLEFNRNDFDNDQTLIRSHVELTTFISNCVNSFSSIAHERGIQLEYIAYCQETWLNLDTLKMQSVMTNLISNALKFVKDNTGKVTISLKKTSEHVFITVEDNGTGISEEDIKMIFIRFYQARNQKNNHGSGIGLYLVKKYVEQHEGQIDVSSNRLSTKFTVMLPLKGNNAIPANNEIKLYDFDKGKQTIIIIDDNHEIVEILCESLTELYNCIVAFDGKDGLEKIEKMSPCLAVIDQVMPGMNGFQLVRALKHNTNTANIPIIMLTAQDDHATEIESIKLGIDVFMPKPFDIHKIILQIGRLIQNKKTTEKAVRIANIANPQFTENFEKTENQDEKLAEQITKIIEDNIEDESFNVTMLAEKMGFNQKQLYRKVKQILGLTPVAYIKKIKMKKAAFLLKDGRFTVTEVMYMVGYSNMSYFIKCFEEEYKLTPKHFLERKSNSVFH